MPINAYVGLQGSGKTYEVVSSVILPALLLGRRIVTNIAGLKLDAIEEYFLEQEKAVRPNVRVLTNTELTSKELLYHGEDGSNQTIVQPGDLVIIDEAFRIWGTEAGITKEEMVFFREHRHYVDPKTGIACDLVLISQAIEDVHKKIRVVIERTFQMRKIKEFGTKNWYTVHQYERGYIRRSAQINSWRKSYDPKIYALYDSYAVKVGAASGIESVVDKRQNILADRSLWIGVASLFVLLVVACGFLWHFFHGAAAEKAPVAKAKPEAKNASGAGQGAAPPRFPAASATMSQIPAVRRLVGFYATPAGLAAVIQVEGGGYRFVYNPENFRQIGNDISVVQDGQTVTPYSGVAATPKSPVPEILK